MQVEHVAREGFAARWAAHQQGHLTIGVGLLGEVVVDHQRMATLVEEVLGHRATGVRSDVLDRRGLRGICGNHNRVVHGAVLAELLNDLRHGGGLLADRDVDADHAGVLLVDDRVDRDSGLACLTVTNDQLALATTNRHEGVERLQTCLQWLLHGLTINHARRLVLERALLGRLDRGATVNRHAERVDDATNQRFADGNAHHLAGASDGIALANLLPLTEQHNGDVGLLEVEGEAGHTMRQLQHLEGNAALEAVDAGNAVANLDDGADFLDIGGVLETTDLVLEDGCDLVGAQLHVFLRQTVGMRAARRSRPRRSRRRRNEASTRRSRTRRTTPPRMLGSTVRSMVTASPVAAASCF